MSTSKGSRRKTTPNSLTGKRKDSPLTDVESSTDSLTNLSELGDDVSADVSLQLSDSILEAQREADALADQAESKVEEGVLEAILMAPKLLQLPASEVNETTQGFKQRGQQLDLLLLKAESYSQFILANQQRSQLTHVVESSSSSSDKKKKPSRSSAKKAKGSDDSPSTEPQTHSPPTSMSVETTASLLHTQPANLVGGTLMPYQLEGVQWLLSLWENGLSGILADEMGLGKTIQIIGLIAQLRATNTSGPFLIAGPLATLPNWMNEFKKWLPSCPVVLYHGSRAEREEIRRKKMHVSTSKDLTFPIVVTSFEICMIDRPALERYTWQYIILDEGHRIKNRNCKLVKELKSLRSVSRLLLTGTPIQNTLEELWALLNFCSPQIFDDLEVFQSWFGFRNIGKDTQVDDIIDTEQRQRVVTKLHGILRPFLLRRLKRDVLLTMPPKREIVVYCGMSSLQREYYARIQAGTLRETLMQMGIEGAKDISTQNSCMQLRKACNHPFLFGEPRDDNGLYLGESNPRYLVMASGKLKLLDRMLDRLKRDGHKVLIFSQMTEVLNILEDYLATKGKGFRYCRLDGNTKVLDRQDAIDRFNRDPDLFVFLLSTRAGGLGINLTAADTCILFDSDWNPHQDSQAQDRCHRYGQARPVVAYRLLTAGSVEIDMMEKQISKKKLERITIHGGDYRKAGQRGGGDLTLDRLRQLLEDDVKNLSRMTQGRDRDFSSSSSSSSSSGSGGGDAQKMEISDAELDLIMDRKLLFPADSRNSSEQGEVSFPVEGQFYDCLSSAASEGFGAVE